MFDACRAPARGITGCLEVWRQGTTSADTQLDIERDADLAICETATESLRVVPWRPRPDITSQKAVSRRNVQPPAAIFCVADRLPTLEPKPVPEPQWESAKYSWGRTASLHSLRRSVPQQRNPPSSDASKGAQLRLSCAAHQLCRASQQSAAAPLKFSVERS
jgi:hypothetical protein